MRYKELTGLAGRLALSPRSSVRGGGTSADLNSTFQMSWCVVSKSSRSVWCLAGSNSHKLNARCWHGRIWRKSMTWTTLTSLIFLLIMFLMHFWSPVSSTDELQDRPFTFQEVSRVGIPDQNSGAATQLVSRGLVM